MISPLINIYNLLHFLLKPLLTWIFCKTLFPVIIANSNSGYRRKNSDKVIIGNVTDLVER
jgi:hypothetical protein